MFQHVESVDWTRRFGDMNISGMAAFHLPASQYEQGESRSVTHVFIVHMVV
jgi:hypothetical protein